MLEAELLLFFRTQKRCCCTPTGAPTCPTSKKKRIGITPYIHALEKESNFLGHQPTLVVCGRVLARPTIGAVGDAAVSRRCTHIVWFSWQKVEYAVLLWSAPETTEMLS